MSVLKRMLAEKDPIEARDVDVLVSVLIPTKDRPAAVVDAVASVLDGTYQKFELIVIDQSEGAATHYAMKSFLVDMRVRYIRNKRAAVGAASSRNVGIAVSSGELIAIIDDDVTARPNWLENSVAEFTADPTLQFVCGKLAAPQSEAGTGFYPSFDPDYLTSPLTDWTMPEAAAGANFIMRRSLFDQLGVYDECFGPGMDLISEDTELAARIARSGARWKACGLIEVVHTHGFRKNADAPRLLKQYARGNGAVYGRFTRRGDITAGLWFLQQQAREIVATVLPNILRGRRPTGFGWVRDRLTGFIAGFLLSPRHGRVGPTELRAIRADHSQTLAPDTGPPRARACARGSAQCVHWRSSAFAHICSDSNLQPPL